MEWFKHKTGSLDDPDFNLILDEFGSDGYMMFFGLLEIYGKEYSGVDSEGFLHISSGFVARKLRKSSAKVRKFLNFCQKYLNKTPWEYSLSGNTISYKVPKFIELSSNWTKRQHKTPTEAPTEAPLKKRITEEEEEEEEKKKKDIKKVDYPDFLNLDLWKEFKKFRTAIKAKMTPHAEKINITELKKLIDQGESQEGVINQTISRGWKGFFPVNNKDDKAKLYEEAKKYLESGEKNAENHFLKHCKYNALDQGEVRAWIHQHSQ